MKTRTESQICRVGVPLSSITISQKPFVKISFTYIYESIRTKKESRKQTLILMYFHSDCVERMQDAVFVFSHVF